MVIMLKAWFDAFKEILMNKQIREWGQNPPAFQAAFPAFRNVYTALPASFFGPRHFSWVLVRITVQKDATAIEKDYMAPILSVFIWSFPKNMLHITLTLCVYHKIWVATRSTSGNSIYIWAIVGLSFSIQQIGLCVEVFCFGIKSYMHINALKKPDQTSLAFT